MNLILWNWPLFILTGFKRLAGYVPAVIWGFASPCFYAEIFCAWKWSPLKITFQNIFCSASAQQIPVAQGFQCKFNTSFVTQGRTQRGTALDVNGWHINAASFLTAW